MAPPPPVFDNHGRRAGRCASIGDYLTPHSDIVALLVLEHQLHAMNLMTRAAWEHRLAERPPAATGAPATRPPSPPAPRVQEAVDELADYLLFVDEVPLGMVKGNAGFAEWFAAQGPKDAAGRSLRSCSSTAA